MLQSHTKVKTIAIYLWLPIVPAWIFLKAFSINSQSGSHIA